MNLHAQLGLRSDEPEGRSRRKPHAGALAGSLRRSIPLLLSGLIVFPAAGDPLSDLRGALQRYPAKTPLRVSAVLQVNSDAHESGARGGSTTFEAEVGPGGLAIRVPPAALGAAESEAAGKKRDSDNPTPTRSAIVALTIFDVIDALDAAAMLLNDLNGATLISRTPSTLAGRPATLLRVTVKPTLAGTRSRFVNEPTIELRVWLDSGGIPVRAERDSNYSASFLFVKLGNVRKERWELAVSGDRLYATRNDENDLASAVGKTIVSSRSVTYFPK